MNISISAQSKDQLISKPISIYSISSNLFSGKNHYSALKERLNFKEYAFVFIDEENLVMNQVSFNIRKIGQKPSIWINDDFMRFRDENLIKGFQQKYDPTRWNLWSPNPLSVYIESLYY